MKLVKGYLSTLRAVPGAKAGFRSENEAGKSIKKTLVIASPYLPLVPWRDPDFGRDRLRGTLGLGWRLRPHRLFLDLHGEGYGLVASIGVDGDVSRVSPRVQAVAIDGHSDRSVAGPRAGAEANPRLVAGKVPIETASPSMLKLFWLVEEPKLNVVGEADSMGVTCPVPSMVIDTPRATDPMPSFAWIVKLNSPRSVAVPEMALPDKESAMVGFAPAQHHPTGRKGSRLLGLQGGIVVSGMLVFFTAQFSFQVALFWSCDSWAGSHLR